MHIKYISLLTSTGGILLLYTLSLYAQTPIITIDEVAEYEGVTVTTNGTVIEFHDTSYGNQLITIQYHNTTLILFNEEPIQTQKGDILQATGTIQQYNDDWELIVDKPEHLIILQTWTNNTLTLGDIATNPLYYLNQNVNITAYVDLIYDDYFHLIDTQQTYHCIAKKPYIQNFTLYPGQQVYLHAYFTYDEQHTRYLFEFTEYYHTIRLIEESTR